MGSSNRFSIKIRGKGGHAAMPHLGVDPVMTAVQIAQALQTIITRNRHPLEAAVLSITQIHAGSADNVIPTDAIMAGTVRTFTIETLDLIEKRMKFKTFPTKRKQYEEWQRFALNSQSYMIIMQTIRGCPQIHL
jgi:hippurate hydrolase